MSRINYDISRIRAVAFDVDGVLSPSTVPMADNGEPQRMVNIKDGYALQLAVRSGLHIAIISGARTENIRERYRMLGIEDIYLGASHKLPVLKDWMAAKGLNPEEVAFDGDDIPDIPPMDFVGLAVAPRDAAADVKAVATYITGAAGGMGVARELLEELLKINGHWLDDIKAFGW